MVASRDLSRLIEGYQYWQQALHNPDIERAHDIIMRAAAEIEKRTSTPES